MIDNISFNFTLTPDKCRGADGAYSVECLHKWFCPQFSSYFRDTGMILIFLYIILSWFDYWLWSKGGYAKIIDKYIESPIDINWAWGIFYLWIPLNPHNTQTRLFWHSIIMGTISKALVLFTAVMVYYSL